MSTRDYIAIAEIIRTARNRYKGSNNTIDYITGELADYMARTNPRFKKHLFLLASTSRGHHGEHPKD